MYSYEDRIRAVGLSIKLGKRFGSTIRQLGYPTKNSLVGWYREYEQSRDLQDGYARSRQKYSAVDYLHTPRLRSGEYDAGCSD